MTFLGKKHSEEAKRKCSLAKIGINNPNFIGKTTNVAGYVCIYSPYHPYANNGKYVMEHRLIMEKQIKRFLLPSESIHHINGIRNDNRIENLVLCQSESEHQNTYHKTKKRE